MEFNRFFIICLLILCSTVIFIVSIMYDYKCTKSNDSIDTLYFEKRMTRIHRNYIVGFLTLGVISLLTALYGGDSKSNIFTYISFASTITSFVLSILAIFVTMQSNSGLENQISKMESHSKLMKKLSIKLNKTLTQVTTVNENIEKSTRKLSEVSNDIIPQVQETLNHHEDIIKEKLDVFNSLNKVSKEKNKEKSSDISLESHFLGRLSLNGLAAIYACCFSNEKHKEFNLYELFQSNSPYCYGIIVASSCAKLLYYQGTGEQIMCETCNFKEEDVYNMIKKRIERKDSKESILNMINKIRNYFGLEKIDLK